MYELAVLPAAPQAIAPTNAPRVGHLKRALCCSSWVLAGTLALVTWGTAVWATPEAPRAAIAPITLAQQAPSPRLIEGVHFYGQASEPDQIGAGYMVFQAQGDRVVGAIFMPSSSFDCFQGRIEGGELALQITNSYTQETYPYAIALETSAPIAAQSGEAFAPLGLAGFHPLGEARSSELALLQTCIAPAAESASEI